MSGKHIDLTAAKLLEKFGAGNHNPGAGSAAALQAMLAAQMLRTVIDLTNEPKQKIGYAKYLPELLHIKREIESRIYPALETLFQEDPDQFDEVIKLRKQRDKEEDVSKWRLLAEEAREALKPATELPLKIAKLSLELGDFAAVVFDKGYRSVRGESAGALNAAVSCVASCLAIVELNLRSFSVDQWAEEIRLRKKSIKSRYEKLKSTGDQKLAVLEKESEDKATFHDSFAYFKNGNLADSIRTNSEIEEIVTSLQNALWKHRKKIWKHETPENPLQILRPGEVLQKVLNYNYQESKSLGLHEVNGEWFEIAGLIDISRKLVQVSMNFPKETQNFTAAHELAHAILHRQHVLHRDRSIDSSANTPKSLEEMQADKFATYFLMPASLVENAFRVIFQMPKFVINENTVLALRERNISALRHKCQNIRGLARVLASAKYFEGRSFNSLAKIFDVSVETMAIRLEELDLLDF